MALCTFGKALTRLAFMLTEWQRKRLLVRERLGPPRYRDGDRTRTAKTRGPTHLYPVLSLIYSIFRISWHKNLRRMGTGKTPAIAANWRTGKTASIVSSRAAAALWAGMADRNQARRLPVARKEGKRVRLYSRPGNDLTYRLAKALRNSAASACNIL